MENTSVPLLLLLIPALAAAQTTQAAAQTPSAAETVVVTATASPVAADTVGRTVQTITREDIERLGLTSVVEALRLVPGVDPRARGPRDVQTDFSIRGATFGQSLVLVDGLRLNSAQTGHHNGDIPVPVAGLDRIEVLAGPGSSVHGADALGGAINFISRRDDHAVVTASAGQHGFASAQTSIGGHGLPDTWAATGWASRSGGFMFDRDFAIGGAGLRGAVTPAWTVDVRHQRKAFGANGFYGASPSKEWTDQTLASVAWRRAAGAWITTARGLARNQGDHFRWDIARPGFAENRHRTNAADLSLTAERSFAGGRRLTMGTSAGGDRVTSSNLGDREYGRAAAFAEVQTPLGARTTMQTGLRIDRYSTFGSAVSPTVAIGTRLSGTLRVRASVSRAFRIPTFTELYYHDPANLGSPDLTAEHGWSLDAGVEWARDGWSLSVSPFRRWDDDVIDWVRETPANLWRSTNLRDVVATGFEVSATRRMRAGFVRVHYAGLDVDAPALNLLSKYVLEYAKRQIGGSITTPIGAGLRAAMSVDHRARVDGQSYALVAAKISRVFGRGEVFVDATNLLNERYHEVAGVAMPGRWVTVGMNWTIR